MLRFPLLPSAFPAEKWILRKKAKCPIAVYSLALVNSQFLQQLSYIAESAESTSTTGPLLMLVIRSFIRSFSFFPISLNTFVFKIFLKIKYS